MKFSKEATQGYLTDPKAEQDGIWVEINDTVKMCVRRAGGRNSAYSRALTQAARKYRRRIDNDLMTNEEVERKITRPAFIQHCMVDWMGVTDADGNDVPFSAAAAEAYFDAVPDVYATLANIASDIQWFREEDNKAIADDLGNSSSGH